MATTPHLVNRVYQHLGEPAASAIAEWLGEIERSLDAKIELVERRLSAVLRSEMKVAFAEQDVRWERRFAEGFSTLQAEIRRVEARIAWQLTGIIATLIGVILAIGGVYLRLLSVPR